MRRLQGSLKELGRDSDFVNNLLEKRNIKKHKDMLERKYNIRRKTLKNVMEEMKPLAGVDIKRRIFQGDSLSSLLFVLCLIPLTVILCK